MKLLEAKKIVKELAKDRYHAVKFELTEYGKSYSSVDEKLETRCSVYIDGESWYSGITWEDAILSLREEMEGKILKTEELEQGV